MTDNLVPGLTTRVKLLDKKARVPALAKRGDAGYDLTFIGVEKIDGDVIFFKTGIAIQPPFGYYYEVVPRSSISKLPLEMANSVGVIDEEYRGEVLVAVRVTHPNMGQNISRTSYPGGVVTIFNSKPPTIADVAQLILTKKPVLFQMILRKRLESEMVVVEDLTETDRGAGGFGSTDKEIPTYDPDKISNQIKIAINQDEIKEGSKRGEALRRRKDIKSSREESSKDILSDEAKE